MAFEITIPRLGWSMEEGTLVRWLKKDGDVVKAGDALFELEGEKAAQDIEAVDSGILKIPATSPQPGSVVAVGAIIGYLLAEGESIPSSTGAVIPPAIEKDKPSVESELVRQSSSFETPAAPPSVRRMAREMGLKLSSIEGSGPAGRIMASDVRGTTSGKAKLSPNSSATRSAVSTPRARRVARELEIDWRQVSGSGREGRVREADIREAALRGTNAVASTKQSSSRRKTIANRMKASRDRSAPVTLTTRVDATNLVSLRNQFKLTGDGAAVPSYSDIILKLVTLALIQHPTLATREEGDDWLVPSSPEELNVGIAVDTNDGLIVPVVRQAGVLGLLEIAAVTQKLIAKSRSGQLTIAEMQGGVFTITNLGAFGIDAFTPIINLPETAILGLGRILREAVVVGEQIVPRDQMTLSLTFDHRIVDGAPAARFLQTVSQAIENPSAWLLREIR